MLEKRYRIIYRPMKNTITIKIRPDVEYTGYYYDAWLTETNNAGQATETGLKTTGHAEDIDRALDGAYSAIRTMLDQERGRHIDADDLERIESDAYGNPRHVIHYTALGLDGYHHDDRTKKAGLEKYRGKRYGGMFIVHGYGDRRQLAHELTKVFYPESITN